MRNSMQIMRRASLAVAALVATGSLVVQAPLAAAETPTPTPSPAQGQPTTSGDAKAQVEKLQKEQADLEAQYKTENEKLQRLMGQNETKRADIAALQTKVDKLRDDLGQVALAQYKAGGTSQSVQLARDPQKFLNGLSQADKIGSSVSDQLRSLQNEQAELAEMQRQLQADQNASQASRDKLADLDKQAKAKLTEAQKLFDKLTAEEKKKIEEAEAAKKNAAAATAATQSAQGTPSTTGQSVAPAAPPSGPSQATTFTYGGGSTYSQPAITPQGNAYDWGNCTYWVYIRRLEVGRPIGSFWGNAAQWPGSAASAGFTVDSIPEAGAAFVQYGGIYGHVMFVERVNGDGTMLISEMNYNWMTGVRTERTIPAVGTFIH